MQTIQLRPQQWSGAGDAGFHIKLDVQEKFPKYVSDEHKVRAGRSCHNAL